MHDLFQNVHSEQKHEDITEEQKEEQKREFEKNKIMLTKRFKRFHKNLSDNGGLCDFDDLPSDLREKEIDKSENKDNTDFQEEEEEKPKRQKKIEDDWDKVDEDDDDIKIEADEEVVNTEPVEKRYRPYSLRVFKNVWEQMGRGLKFKKIVLLAQVDKFRNNYHKERNMRAYFKISTLAKKLRCNAHTVSRLIKELIEQDFMTGEKIDNSTWELETPECEREPDDLTVPAFLVQAFERGELKDYEMFVMAKISSFTSRGKHCWCGNRAIGEGIGLSSERVKVIIRGLKAKGWLYVLEGTTDEVVDALSRCDKLNETCEAYKYGKSGKSIQRLLVPVHKELKKKDFVFIKQPQKMALQNT